MQIVHFYVSQFVANNEKLKYFYYFNEMQICIK